MAKKPVADKQHLVCKITDISPDPKREGRMLVVVQFDDGDPAGPWHQPYSLSPDRFITLDDFLNKVASLPVARPTDPYAELKRLLETQEPFVLNLSPIIKESE